MKTGFKLTLNVSPFSDEQEVFFIKNKMLALSLFDYAYREKLFPVLSTFEESLEDEDYI